MKRVLLLSVLFLVNVSVSFSQAGWSIPPDSVYAGRFDDVYFTDSLYGFACGTGMKNNPGSLVVKTTDGGLHWDTSLVLQNKYLRSIEFMDHNIGFLGTLDTAFYRTADGGATWQRIDHLVPGPLLGICGLSKADSTTIYGVGIYASPSYVIKSTDKGNTWSFIDMSSYCGALVDAKFFSADTGYVSGYDLNERGIILYTTNGGQDWEVKATTPINNSWVWKLDFPDRIHAYASIEQIFVATGTPEFLKSNDGGLSWVQKPISNNSAHRDLEGIGFIDARKGWVGGHFNGMYETQDSGQTWTFYNYGGSYNRFHRLTSKKAVFSGNHLYQYDGTNVFIGNTKGSGILAHNIRNIYPSPANDHAKISYEISNRTLVTIGLYDINGKLIRQLVRTPQVKGNYEINLDVSGLSNGQYLIIMKTHERHLAKPFSIMH